MAATLIVNEQLTRHTFSKPVGPLPAGSANPVWDDIVQLSVRNYHATAFIGNKAHFTGENQFAFVNSAWLAKVCGNQAGQYQQELIDVPFFLLLPDADLGDDVPAILNAANHVNEDGTLGARKTWLEWAQGIRSDGLGNSVIELNGGGVVEPGSTVAVLINAGATILNLEETREVLPDTGP